LPRPVISPPGDLLLRVVLRHAPVVELADIAAGGVEGESRFLGRVVERLRALVGDGIAGLLAAQRA
jgi:hypothetical protein